MTQYGLAVLAVEVSVFLLFAKVGKLNMRALLFLDLARNKSDGMSEKEIV